MGRYLRLGNTEGSCRLPTETSGQISVVAGDQTAAVADSAQLDGVALLLVPGPAVLAVLAVYFASAESAELAVLLVNVHQSELGGLAMTRAVHCHHLQRPL